MKQLKMKKDEISHTYIAIDLKSFYASVEAIAMGLDPLTTNLVVADASRTEKTICLAVSPSLKAYGIPGRARLFEVIRKVREANSARLSKWNASFSRDSLTQPERKIPASEDTSWQPEQERNVPVGVGSPARSERKQNSKGFSHKSVSSVELAKDPSAEIDFLVAPPRMAHYITVSSQIYRIYMKYLSPEDIHVYSIDEIIADVTGYLAVYGRSAHELARRMIGDVLKETGITATAGIGTNMYLAKVAMDVMAKHVEPDEDGVRIAELDEMTYRQELWTHRPLTDFWRVGPGYRKKLEEHGMFTMGDVARCSVQDEDLLYDLFGKNAELLIDHAWGYEPCTMEQVKAYRPETNSFSSGQVLPEPYPSDKARIVVHEMADAASLDLVAKKMVTDQLVLTVVYDIENLKNNRYQGTVTTDRYGRQMPRHAHGTTNLKEQTSSSRRIDDAVLELYDRIVDRSLLVRRIYLSVNHVVPENARKTEDVFEQMDLFTDYSALEQERKKEQEVLRKEHQLQEAMLAIRRKFGKNALLKGINFEEGATGRDRNRQIGGHRE